MNLWNTNIRYDNIGYWPRKLRFTIHAIFTLLFLFVILIFNIQPLVKQLKLTTNKESQLKITLDKRKLISRQLPIYKKKLQQLQKQAHNLITRLPNHMNFSHIMAVISTLGQLAQLKLELLQPETIKASKLYKTLPIKIKATGNFQQIMHFLDLLLHNNQTFTLAKYKIHVNTISNQLVLDLMTNAYYTTLPLNKKKFSI